jgi:hypothetical protein
MEEPLVAWSAVSIPTMIPTHAHTVGVGTYRKNLLLRYHQCKEVSTLRETRVSRSSSSEISCVVRVSLDMSSNQVGVAVPEAIVVARKNGGVLPPPTQSRTEPLPGNLHPLNIKV